MGRNCEQGMSSKGQGELNVVAKYCMSSVLFHGQVYSLELPGAQHLPTVYGSGAIKQLYKHPNKL